MRSQGASVPRSLELLPARPPTPPREKKQDANSSSNHVLSNQLDDTGLNLHTPPNYSPGSIDNTNVSSRRSRKKVGFLTEAEYQDAPTYADKENVGKQSTPASAPQTIIKPIKSILKQTSSPGPQNPLDPSAAGDESTGQVNIVAMLDSTIKQIAGADRQSKIDAYMTLARALKTSNNLPDRVALQDKMSLFTQFIQRDVTAKGPNGNIDSSLVNHALTLFCTFLHFPGVASTISSDFGVFIIDHCIRSFEDPSVPKDVVRHLMQVVAYQDFSAKVMTSDRIGRLVNSLHKIEEHIKGKSIIMSRIFIYRRLVKQSKTHMVTHSDWLLDLFTDMLSSMKEIRASAIALGLEASFTIGKEKQLSRRVMEILNLQVDETKYIEYYVERLMNMTKDKVDSASVPQVWSVVILLLRCPVDRWEFFAPWLEIIQRCFNSGDYLTKLEANYAWNRLVYALHFNETSFSKTIGTICQPFISQLRRKGSSKQLDELRKVVVASVCNLFYYVFKPNLSTAQVDSYWDACTRPLLQRLASPDVDGKQVEKSAIVSENLTQATLILTGLFNSSTPRLWKEDRVAENSLVKPDELPSLDPKWVRQNSARVFAVMEPILQRTFLNLANAESALYKLWCTLVGAVAVAASKEVKVSTDTATFMAHAFSALVRIWSQGLSQAEVQPDTQQRFLDAAQTYLSVMTEYLGLLPFTEKLLSLNTQNSFIPVATPSHRSGKAQGLTRTPLHHLFSILSAVPPGIPDDDGLLNLLKVVFDPFVISRSSSHAKTDLARELMQTLPIDVLLPYGSWVFLSDILSLSLENSQSSYLTTTSGSDSTPLGHEYREIVKHLEKGVRATPNLPWEHWHSLFRSLVTRVTYEAGEAGCAIVVVEPLAKSLLELSSPENLLPYNYLKSGIELVATAKQPQDRQALDAARRRLWGTSIAGSRSASFDPFDNLYRLTNSLLENSYTHIKEYDETDILVPLLSEVASFLMRCSHSLVFKSLVHLQHGISLWIEDANAQYSSKQSSKVSDTVKILWARICSLLLDSDSLESSQLDAVEELLCSAFQSKHRDIINAVSTMWNCAFERVEEIQYPEKLKEVLITIHSYVDIVLPGLDLSSYGSTGQEPSFIESQDDFEAPNSSMETTRRHRTPPVERPPSRRSTTPGSIQLSLFTKQQPKATPNVSRPRSARNSTTPRPRHNDSQIEFAPIASSSPGQNSMESQPLTDRQKEVRERQRENAAMYPQIRVSTEKRKSSGSASKRSNQKMLPYQGRAATPQPSHGLEDYVSSTPTPRRGQAPVVDDDHEMTDVPSSPPEPRRNLLAEMMPRSRSNSVFQDFPISSSPISGSPAPKRQTTSANDTLAELGDRANVRDDVLEAIHDESDEVVEPDQMDTNMEDVDVNRAKAIEESATPRKTRSSGRKLKSSPRSDREVFVDAPTSPVIQTPRNLRSHDTTKGQRAQPPSGHKDRSFELSDDEEQSLARLVIELDSRKCAPLPRPDTKSPEKPQETNESAVDCITVSTNSRRLRSQSRLDESNQSLPVTSSPSPENGTPHSSSKKSKKKRKRHAEKNQESGGSHKKRKHGKHKGEEDAEAIPNTQVSENSATDATDTVTAMEEYMELDTDMSFSEVQEPTAATAVQEDSSPMSFDDSFLERESDTEAVNLQIITEASQLSEVEATRPDLLQPDRLPVNTEAEMINQEEEGQKGMEKAEGIIPEQSRQAEEAVVEKSAAEKIMDALKGGLEGLRTAKLTRAEVNKIEDVFFDIKKELYQAESRSRR
ncbi:hypothetical protein F5Y05DRAFT_49211 [Hypoxylon sp. FL0543]|nr:hypothetical protein F5Y05DRAFT_49211 [Hypoxylon sp. FL0543]